MSFSSISNVIILLILLFSFNITYAKDLLINEIAWMGTENSANDEWIELYNNSDKNISLENHKLIIGNKEIKLKGIIKANNFYILERTDDTTLPQIKADLIFTGSIKNTGEIILLKNDNNNIIDEADFSSGWIAGDNKTKHTMERIEDLWQTSLNKGGSPNAINIKAFNQNTREEIKPTSDQTKEKQEEKYSSIQEIQKENNNFPLKIMLGISFISGTVIVFIRKQLKA